MASSRSVTDDSIRWRTSAPVARGSTLYSFSPAAKIRSTTLLWSPAARRSLSFGGPGDDGRNQLPEGTTATGPWA